MSMAFGDMKVVLTGPWVSFQEKVITQRKADGSGAARDFSLALCSPPSHAFLLLRCHRHDIGTDLVVCFEPAEPEILNKPFENDYLASGILFQ